MNTSAGSSSGALTGARVLVTRPRERSEELCFLLEDEGAEVVLLPVMEFLPPENPQPLRAAAEQLSRYAWVLFTSPTAVNAMADAVRRAGNESLWKQVKLGAVGPKTAQAIADLGLDVDCQAESASGASLAQTVRGLLKPTDEVLLPAAEDGRRELFDALEGMGIRVARVCAYRGVQAAVPADELEAVMKLPPHIALFASPRAAQLFLESSGASGRTLLSQVRRVAIGPTTAKMLEDLGFSAHVVAQSPTSASLVDAAIQAFRV